MSMGRGKAKYATVLRRQIFEAPRFSGFWCKLQDLRDDGTMPRFVPAEELFKGRHFDQEIVVLCVRWYISFKLSYRDLVP